MGGCATKPKDSNLESLPREASDNPKPSPQVGEDKPTTEVKADAGESQSAETLNKEEPLLDLSEPKPEPPGSEADTNVVAQAGITELVSEIGNLDASSQGLAKDSGDAHKAEEAGSESTEPKKERFDAESEHDIILEPESIPAEPEVTPKKSDVVSTESSVNNDVTTSTISA